jgi:uncharacterized membrane-anchored protein
MDSSLVSCFKYVLNDAAIAIKGTCAIIILWWLWLSVPDAPRAEKKKFKKNKKTAKIMRNRGLG